MTHLDPVISTLVMGLQVEVCEPNLNDTARGNPDIIMIMIMIVIMMMMIMMIVPDGVLLVLVVRVVAAAPAGRGDQVVTRGVAVHLLHKNIIHFRVKIFE